MRTPPLSPAAGSLNLPLPRPPAWICALTTQTGPPSSFAAFAASPGFSTGTPRETGTPNSRSTAFAWYSWMFISSPRRAAARIVRASRESRVDLLAGFDQALHGRHRFGEHLFLARVELDLDDLLHAVGAKDDGHADIEIVDAILAVEI